VFELPADAATTTPFSIASTTMSWSSFEGALVPREVDHVRPVTLGVGDRLGDPEYIAIAFRVEHAQRHDLGWERYEVHDPGHTRAVANHLVLLSVAALIPAERTVRGIPVVAHEVVALDPPRSWPSAPGG
jgi:hypothetical protein